MKLNYTAKLYSDVEGSESAGIIIEGMTDYLNLKTPIASFTNLAPISLSSDISIRLDMEEGWAGQFVKPNYLWLKSSQDVDTYQDSFWFVRSIERVANQTVRLTLHMDVLNTFASIIETGLSPRTFTIREHRNRFYTPDDADPYYRAKVDDVSEGISVLKIRKSIERIASESWYLIYKTKEDLSPTNLGNPISCYACADSAKLVKKGFTGPQTTWAASQFTAGFYYYISPTNNQGFTLTVGSETYNYNDKIWDDTHFVRGAIMFRSGDSISVGIIRYNSDEGYSIQGLGTYSSVVFKTLRQINYGTVRTDQIAEIDSMTKIDIFAGTTADLYSLSIGSLNRQDSKLVKIIKLPYPPSDTVTDSSGNLSLNGFSFDHDTNLFKLNDESLNYEFGTNIYSSNLTETLQLLGPMSLTDLRKTYDPKVLHSDFRTDKLVYDSFSLPIYYERIGYKAPDQVLSFSVYFKPTNTINSNMLFSLSINTTYQPPEDYDVMTVTRNNEIPIFSNDYVNYIKTGFNYDKKAKAEAAAVRWSGVGVSAASSMVMAAAFAAHPVAAATAATFYTVSSLISAIGSQAQADNTLDEKLSQLKAQSTSVAGSDDVDLLSDYAKNNLLRIIYEPSEQTLSMLNDLFYYYGYATNRTKVPNTGGRIWFNFVQCKPIFKPSAFTALGEYREEIESKLRDGVTIFHENLGVWDLDQTHENYETTLLNQ